MTTWFTSDQHFGHANIIKFCNRPYDSVEEMDEDLIARHNAVVKPSDTVWYLGDFSYHKPAQYLQILRRLHGIKGYIWGNHDSHSMRNNPEVLGQFALGCHDYKEISVEGQHICMMHFPILEWNKGHRGSWMLHGHSHGNATYGHLASNKIYDVGVDPNELNPVSFQMLQRIFRNASNIQHH